MSKLIKLLLAIVIILLPVTSYPHKALTQTGFEVIAEIPVGVEPVGVAVNTTTNMIYVTNYQDNSVSVIDGVTNTVIDTIAVGNAPYGIAVNPNTNRIYVALREAYYLSVIDGSTNTIKTNIPLAQEPFVANAREAVRRAFEGDTLCP